jgi:hypothetical protein
MLEATGWPDKKGALREVSARLGLHDITLLRWARRAQNPAPDNLVNDKKLEVSEIVEFMFRGFASEILARVSNGDLIDEQTSTLLTGFGIGFDKMQLLAGKPTSRVATVQEELAETPEDERDAVIAEAEAIIRAGTMGGPRS